MTDEPGSRSGAGRWLLVAVAALAIVALLAWARNDPGVGGRVPDPEDAAAVVQGGSHVE
ncbi:MAG TPA: hypothetical protein VFY82_11105 [Acidimicrobiales bacterium]|nr:hypothetical protein [Acidimicrobiales bacterium]